MPLLIFYALSFIAVMLRLLTMIWQFTFKRWVAICFVVQPMAKISVGLVQAWMLFELAMRFRSASDKRLNIAKMTVMVLILLLFFAAMISISVTLINARLKFLVIQEELFHITGYMFVGLFFLMLIVNIDLMLQIRKKERSLMKNSLKREKCLLMTILFFFELSYLLRFIYNSWGSNLYDENKFFRFLILEDLTYVFEAVSFLALVGFHFKNFRPQASQEKIDDPRG